MSKFSFRKKKCLLFLSFYILFSWIYKFTHAHNLRRIEPWSLLETRHSTTRLPLKGPKYSVLTVFIQKQHVLVKLFYCSMQGFKMQFRSRFSVSVSVSVAVRQIRSNTAIAFHIAAIAAWKCGSPNSNTFPIRPFRHGSARFWIHGSMVILLN